MITKRLFVGGPEHGTVKEIEVPDDYAIMTLERDDDPEAEFLHKKSTYYRETIRSYPIGNFKNVIDVPIWCHQSVMNLSSASRDAYLRDALIRLVTSKTLVDFEELS